MNAGTRRQLGSVGLACVVGAGLWGLSVSGCSSSSNASGSDAKGGSQSAAAGATVNESAGHAATAGSEAGDSGQEQAGANSGSDGGAAGAEAVTGGVGGSVTGGPMGGTSGAPDTTTDNLCPIGPTTDQGQALCSDCISSYCCTEIGACSAQADCKSLQTCLLRCESTDQPCIDGCDDLFPAGVTNYNNLANCASFECHQACDPAPPGCQNVPLGTDAECDQVQYFSIAWVCPDGPPEPQCAPSPTGTANEYCCLY
jgi:hypothetical protein